MRIRQLVLKDYKLIRESGITNLSIDFTAPNQIVVGTNGSGKAQPLNSMIKVPGGWIRMGDITVGTKVSTPEGGEATVIGVHPQGIKEIFKVTFADGRSTRCCEDHLWKVYNVYWNHLEERSKVVPLKEVDEYINGWRNRSGVFVDLISPENGVDVDLPIDPYVLGVLIGDGCLQKKSATITTPDKFIIEEIRGLLPPHASVASRAHPLNYSIISEKLEGYQPTCYFMNTLRDLNLAGKLSYEKTIPDIYMNASSSQRLSLVQGLMDTDGYADIRGSLEFCTTSETLARQFQYLIRSLGGLCKIRSKNTHYLKDGVRVPCRVAYVLRIRMSDPSSIFRLPRKKERASLNTQYNNRLRLRIVSVERSCEEEAQCITIDDPRHLYITDDFVITHNSSTVRQLSTTPSSRSLFDKKGFKSLVIEVDNHYYTLSSDYVKPSAPHSFTRDDDPEELNQGGTTHVQLELIQDLLGITPFIDDLIMNRFHFPSWTPSKRKEFLMAHNPDDIGFVLQHAKQMASKIRACKANLTRLKSRKIVLEQELLDEDTVEQLLQEKHTVTEDLKFFQQALMRIDIAMSGKSAPTLEAYRLPDVRKELKRIQYQLSALSSVDRDTSVRQKKSIALKDQISGYDYQIFMMNEDVLSRLDKLHVLETQYRELDQDGSLSEIEATISRLEHSAQSLKTDKPAVVLTPEELTQRYQQWDAFFSKTQIFESCEIKLYSRKKRALRERLLQQADYRRSSYTMRLSDLTEQRQQLVNRHAISPSDIPNAPCAKNACPLYAHFMEGYENTQAKREKIDRHIQHLQSKLTRLDIYIQGMSRYFQDSKIYHDVIASIVEEAHHNSILHHVLREMNILHVLQVSPQRIAKCLKEHYDHINQWLRYQQIKEDLEIAYTLKSQYNGSQDQDTLKLVIDIENHKSMLSELHSRISEVTTAVIVIKRELATISLYETLLTRVLELRDRHILMMNMVVLHQEHKELSFLQTQLQLLQHKAFLRMGEIERILRDYDTLKARYEEEVVKEILVIEKELADLEHIEKALVAIPKENMIDFINGVLDQTNRILDIVWTVPLQIAILSDTDSLNYEFQVSGDNDTLRELSECSEGQTEILSLAINLALRIQLGHLNLPLVLDEAGRTLDDKHKYRLVELLNHLVNDKIISQLFLVNHHAAVHEGFSDSETLVLCEKNIVLPSVYNQHCVIS